MNDHDSAPEQLLRGSMTPPAAQPSPQAGEETGPMPALEVRTPQDTDDSLAAAYMLAMLEADAGIAAYHDDMNQVIEVYPDLHE